MKKQNVFKVKLHFTIYNMIFLYPYFAQNSYNELITLINKLVDFIREALFIYVLLNLVFHCYMIIINFRTEFGENIKGPERGWWNEKEVAL